MTRSFWLYLTLALVLSVSLAVPVSLALAVTGKGTAVFRDASALSDRLVVAMTEVERPASGKAYEGWLVSDDAKTATSIGIISVSADGRVSHTYTSPNGQNLLGSYNTVRITIEPSPDPEPAKPSADVAFEYTLPGPVATHARHLLYRWDPSPDKKGFVVGGREQLRLAQQHLNLALSDAQKGNLTGARSHAEHVVNIIEGSKGPNYGDLDGDGQTVNPGDGNGVLEYFKGAIAHVGLMSTALPNDPIVKLHGPHVTDSSNNILDWAGRVRDWAIPAARANDLTVALTLLGVAKPDMDKAISGFDADGNGRIDLVRGESGLPIAYEHSQNLAIFSLAAAPPAQPAPTPTPTAAPAPPKVGDVSTRPFLGIALLLGASFLAGGILLLRQRTRKSA
ncbi:MAG: anti-sigma factor [Chloroflexi bacterium]|nr:anti-sigma factor [Chloroflexota bacterium]